MKARQGKIVVLASGGMDSAVLLDWACRRFSRVIPVYVRCGMRWEQAELYWLERLLGTMMRPALSPLQVLDCPVMDLYGRHWSVSKSKAVPGYGSRDEEVFLPGRNLLLLSKVSVYCFMKGIDRVALGTLNANPFGDASPAFLKSFGKSYRAALGKSLKIMAPFRNKDKKAISYLGRYLPLELTFSCLKPVKNRPCGACNKCAERDKLRH